MSEKVVLSAWNDLETPDDDELVNHIEAHPEYDRYQFSFDCPLNASVPEIEVYVRAAIGHLQGRIVTRILIQSGPKLTFQIQVDPSLQRPVETRSIAEMAYDSREAGESFDLMFLRVVSCSPL